MAAMHPPRGPKIKNMSAGGTHNIGESHANAHQPGLYNKGRMPMQRSGFPNPLKGHNVHNPSPIRGTQSQRFPAEGGKQGASEGRSLGQISEPQSPFGFEDEQ